MATSSALFSVFSTGCGTRKEQTDKIRAITTPAGVKE
jgi:hypothetical protein